MECYNGMSQWNVRMGWNIGTEWNVGMEYNVGTEYWNRIMEQNDRIECCNRIL